MGSMDAETAKLIFPLLAGCLTLAGGLLAFINGRLNEAKNEIDRDQVIKSIYSWLSVAFNILSSALFFLGFTLPACATAIVAFCLFVATFIRTRGPVQRGELVIFSLASCGFTAFIVTMFIADILSRYLGITSRIIGILEKITDAPGK